MQGTHVGQQGSGRSPQTAATSREGGGSTSGGGGLPLVWQRGSRTNGELAKTEISLTRFDLLTLPKKKQGTQGPLHPNALGP